LPAVENVVLVPEPPVANAPVPATSQANAVIGLLASVELDTSDTFSPARGADGNQLNDAAGGGRWAAADGDAPVTTNVLVGLRPTFPAASACAARTVYVPGESPANVTDHALPTSFTVMLCTGPPPVEEPEKSCAVTCWESSSSLPAAPFAVQL
jgi:hypothetical protein